jgi:glycosyltransferase involved in cell wall biosynthesis
MRIGLNLLPFLPDVGGTWQYVGSLLASLAEHDSINEYVAFVTRSSESLVPDSTRFARVRVPLHVASRPLRVAFESTVFPSVVARKSLGCLHHFFGGLPLRCMTPNVVTVHDLMVFERPNDFSVVKRNYLRFMVRRAAKHATILAPVSNATANHLQRVLGVTHDRMQIIPATIADDFVPLTGPRVEEFRARYRLPNYFWLLVSGAYPHKNHEMLVRAFAVHRRRRPAGWPLVIRGDLPPNVQATIRETVGSGNVIQLPRLTDDEMPTLYSAASALVFPSLFEGGGQPLMEAMACGCPVVASSIPTTREFAAGAALTFDPTDADALVDAMARCEASDVLRAELSRAGLTAATALRPAVAAAACVEAYRRAVAPGGQ